MHEAAEEFLSEFGGLVFDISGPGISCVREPFELDPLLAEGEEDRFADWSEVLGKSLYPIGEGDQGRYFLAIDGIGAIYLVADWVAAFGPADKALEGLTLGVAPTVVAEEY
jgi:hypothetical protein